MHKRITVGQVIKKAGGIPAIVRLLGYPVNRYTVERWRRKREIPEEHRAKIANHIGVPVEQLDPDTDGKIVRMKYRRMGVVYQSMAAAAEINVRALPKLHGVSKNTVDRWRWGLDEVPVSAIEDIYRLVQSRVVKMTVEIAREMTGLTQTQIAARLGLSPAMGTYWRKRGEIPPEYAERIRSWKKD